MTLYCKVVMVICHKQFGSRRLTKLYVSCITDIKVMLGVSKDNKVL